MKNIFKCLILVSIVSSLGCKKYLDTVPDNILTLEQVFESSQNIDRYIANIYSALPNEFTQRSTGGSNSGNWTGGADEAKYNWDFNYSNKINSSTCSSIDAETNAHWNIYYRAIRSATDFIQRIDGASAPGLTDSIKIKLKGEARGLRAIYYTYLLKVYGPVVLLKDELLPADAPSSDLIRPRANFDICVAFITSEFDKAYTEVFLPTPGLVTSNGRINKAVVKAYKAQLLLFAASPLFNGNTDYASLKNDDGTNLISQSADPTKWAKAAAACKDFLTEFVPGNFDLYTVADPNPFKAAYLACHNVMLVDWNKEWIFGRSFTGSLMKYDRTPKHVGVAGNPSGGGANGVTQTQVDAYSMANGLPITDPASGYPASGFVSYTTPYDVTPRSIFAQWANREPRFYVGVTFNNSAWLYKDANNNTYLTNMEKTGNSGRGQSASDVTPTGYVVRKNVPPTDASARGLVYMRLAEMYLNYAEALNESAPGSADILIYLNLIRIRAGVPAYGTTIPVPSGQAAFRAAIRAERRVELAFENTRYFDTRRWKIAETTDAGPFYGMDLEKSGTPFYNKTLLETRVFKKRDYLFPIPLAEILKNSLLKQNTGW